MIRSVARSLKSQFPNDAEDVEDYEQELAARLHLARPGYDPSRSLPGTFAKHVVMSKAASMVEAHKAKKRCPPVAPARPLLDGSDRERDAEVIDISDLMAVGREKERAAELEKDVADVVAKLTPEHRELCQHLSEGGVSHAAKEMGKSRYWVYAQKEKLRPFLEKNLRRPRARRHFCRVPGRS